MFDIMFLGLHDLDLEVRSRLPPAAEGLVLPFAAVLVAREILATFPIHPEIAQVGTA
jgi:hypothetical protein